MQSITKIILTEDLLQSITRRHCGQGLRRFEELTEGYYNAAARLELEDGRHCVLKVAPKPDVRVLHYERDIMRAEVGAMRLVRERTSVPVPEIWCYDESHQLVESDLFIAEMLPGVPYHKLKAQLEPDGAAKVERQMGALAREIGSLSGAAFGYWAQPQAGEIGWRECFQHMIQALLQDGEAAAVELPLGYDALFRTLEAHFGALEEVTTPRLVHWDLWDGNVFVDPDTLNITGLIDFERALWADPLMEFGFLMLDAKAHFVQGYGGEWFQQEGQRVRRLLYNAYLFLIMVIECTYRKYPTNDQENWARHMLEETLKGLG